MIVLALLIALGVAGQAAVPQNPLAGLPIDVLPRQALPTRGCAAYLFARGAAPAFIAVAGADPAQLRLSIGGVETDIMRTSQTGAGSFGFAGVTEYAGGDITAVLDMKIETRGDVKDGAVVDEASLRIDRAGQDSVVVPVAGIVGCAT